MIRVLISKPGIDGHWRGSVVIARALRDAGMEVIFGGNQTVEQIADTAINEDVDVIGLSIYSGAHFDYVKQLTTLLTDKEEKENFLLICGGAIPPSDYAALKKMGVADVFGANSDVREAIHFIRSQVPETRLLMASIK